MSETRMTIKEAAELFGAMRQFDNVLLNYETRASVRANKDALIPIIEKCQKEYNAMIESYNTGKRVIVETHVEKMESGEFANENGKLRFFDEEHETLFEQEIAEFESTMSPNQAEIVAYWDSVVVFTDLCMIERKYIPNRLELTDQQFETLQKIVIG